MGGRTDAAIGDALSSPLLNIGAGLLASSGPSELPVTLGQGLAQGLQLAQSAQQRQVQNELARQRLTTPRSSSLARNAAALGIDLNSLTDEQKFGLLGGNTQATQQLDLALKALELQNAQTAASTAKTDKTRQEGRAKFTLQSSFEKIQELRQLNKKRRQFLDNPASAASSPLEVANTIQRFNQLTTELVLRGANDPLKDVGSRLTDAARRALFDSKITSTTTPDVTDQILTDMELGLREAAPLFGVKFPKAAPVPTRNRRKRIKFKDLPR